MPKLAEAGYVYRSPGALQTMAAAACSNFQGVHLVDGAGHWVQQEQPETVSAILTDFLHRQLK